MQEYLYILLSQTGTKVSRFIRLFTRKPYNHASVAADLTLQELYSFCRNESHRPLPATFNREQVGKGTFGLFGNIPCEIYAVPISPEQKQAFLRYISHMKHCRARYSYNILGLCTTFFHVRWKRNGKMHCSEFVAQVLSHTGLPLEKQPSLYIPDDFRYLPNATLIYRGELNQYYRQCHAELEKQPDLPEQNLYAPQWAVRQ